MKKRNKWNLLLLGIGMIFLLSGCGLLNSPKQYQTTGFSMGTVISQNMYGGREQIADEVLDVINGLEKTISWRIEGTDVDRINDAAGTDTFVEVSHKLAGWLTDSEKVCEMSKGALDITIGAVARLWDIGGENPRIPGQIELETAMERLDVDELRIEGNKVSFLRKGGQIDLGAVGKGIACDEIYDYIVTNYPDINGTFSVGGSVLIYGEKPNGQSWKVGIRDPRGAEGAYMGSLTFSQKEGERINVSTSGDYEKYFEVDGVRYHHILDPDTGAPAESDLISVTIISESGFLTDALSTACFVAGKDDGLKLVEKFDAEAVVITKNNEIYMTDGAEDYFELLSKEYLIK